MNIATISKQIRAFADQLDATSEVEKPDPYAELKAAHAAGKVIQGLIGGYWIDSPHPTWKYPVDTYRVKPDEPQNVPQSSTFFLPGTVIRFPDASDLWGAIMAIDQDGLVVGDTYQSYQELAASKATANRSIPLTGKWNPDAWEPCSKTIPA